MEFNLYSYQLKAVRELRPGSILCGGVGSGKSRVALMYYFTRIIHGAIDKKGNYIQPLEEIPLYIITTAKKRDSLDWVHEATPLLIEPVVDSWNNIHKYKHIKNAFFIFDEQRLVGYGSWVKSFLEISKNNKWILLSATPGDTWMDYIPVFIANGFYRNRTEFLRKHVIYNRFSKYPKIDKYINVDELEEHRQSILVIMESVYSKKQHHLDIFVNYDKELMGSVLNKRWDVFENKPIKNISGMCYLARKVDSSDINRIQKAKEIIEKSRKIIVFYNFDYELEILKKICEELDMKYGQWNGHVHNELPVGRRWAYLVQYTAGAEGWNCITTNKILFYSQNYSYKIMTQAAGRIDRVNTPYEDLYYYHLMSKSFMDKSIKKALDTKTSFNERVFAGKLGEQ